MSPQLELSGLDHEHLYWLPESGWWNLELWLGWILSPPSSISVTLLVMTVEAATGTMEPSSAVPNEGDEDGDECNDEDERDDSDGAHEDEQLPYLIIRYNLVCWRFPPGLGHQGTLERSVLHPVLKDFQLRISVLDRFANTNRPQHCSSL